MKSLKVFVYYHRTPEITHTHLSCRFSSFSYRPSLLQQFTTFGISAASFISSCNSMEKISRHVKKLGEQVKYVVIQFCTISVGHLSMGIKLKSTSVLNDSAGLPEMKRMSSKPGSHLKVHINTIKSLGVLRQLVTDVFRSNKDAFQVRPRPLHLKPYRYHRV